MTTHAVEQIAGIPVFIWLIFGIIGQGLMIWAIHLLRKYTNNDRKQEQNDKNNKEEEKIMSSFM